MTLVKRWPLILCLPLLLLMLGLWGCQPQKPDPPPPTPDEKPPTQRTYEIFGQRYTPVDSADGFRETGVASWYGNPFHGRKTASGEVYNKNARTAAHRTLPMGTFLVVHNLENQKQTIVRINDRGPFAKDRIIDLSYRSAKEIDMVRDGTARVAILAVDPDDPGIQNQVKKAHPDYFTGDFTVQVGAYSDRERAEAIAGRLHEFQKDITVTPVSVDGRPVYRVRIGHFSDRADAEALMHRLAENGYENVFTVSASQ